VRGVFGVFIKSDNESSNVEFPNCTMDLPLNQNMFYPPWKQDFSHLPLHLLPHLRLLCPNNFFFNFKKSYAVFAMQRLFK